MSTPTAPPASYRVTFPALDRVIEALGDETLFESARRHGVRIVGACGGRGTCGTCMIRMDSVVPGPDGSRKWQRACQVRVTTDCEVEVAPRSLARVVRAEVGATATREDLPPLRPLVRTEHVHVPAPTLQDARADADRLKAAMRVPFRSIDVVATRNLPAILRASGGKVCVRVRADELIGVAPVTCRQLGIAVDLGTTNAAAFLVDFESGETMASLGIENPQVAWGADLIARINHAIQNPTGADELRLAARTALNALVHDLCMACDVSVDDVVDATICCNTAMHHLLLGLPVHQLGRAPFVPAICDALDIRARDLGLRLAAGASVHVVANVGGFVGGDHVAALLATRPAWTGRTSLVMDIGTNTEISLIHEGRIHSASCPSGPALEGGHISSGMRAAEGAIERVASAGDGLSIQTIGGVEPVGICGSGVLDAVASLLEAGAIDVRGRISAAHALSRQAEQGRAAEIAPGVCFAQDDVRAVQLAKAAIRTGVQLLCERAGIGEAQLATVIIAGAFGAYISIESAIAIGLLPDLPRERFVQVGNSAGAGVRRLLLSGDERLSARQLAAQCNYVELSSVPQFQKRFLHNIGFPSRTHTPEAA